MKYRVNIDEANTTKAGFSALLDDRNPRLLNRVGAFSSLFLLDVKRFQEPVLVLKTEEPGSKQVLAFAHDRIESICYDMINHLINDCIVMGAEPLAVQDLIVCGKLEKAIATRIVAGVAAACEAQGCGLTGGETTEQPDIVPVGTYILGSSIVGVVERSQIIDGSKIVPGDVVLALPASGPHTNGYTLIRDLLKRDPSLSQQPVGSSSFLDAVLEPHRCYYQSLKGLFADGVISGLAHITGGGIKENLDRILPKNVNARIDLGCYRPNPVFTVIRQASKLPDNDMLRTFNLGVGIALVCPPAQVRPIVDHLKQHGEDAYAIGEIVPGNGVVECHGTVAY
ncbi:phosphoribosylformylglycinamidine cyclo-ligase [Schlesneria paludicola]|uniref:phosphoribosylformylglycinamidine cyclo-ligase n=1 Tax=Schlesneria paludicola TaxID=360056 RepID=UPI00029AFE86|nr:phosphoribosylformylglycinamidine cyclo-ligase [Schlesneria paludicola]